MNLDSIYTLNLNLDSDPSRISWCVTDYSVTRVIYQSRTKDFYRYKPYQSIQQNFSLPDKDNYVFILMSSTSKGIKCNTPPCYNLTMTLNSTHTRPLFVGYGNFTRLESYYFGANLSFMQKPFYQGALNILPYSLSRSTSNNQYFIAGGIIVCVAFILIIYSIRTHYVERKRYREDEIRRQEERELDLEIEGKLITVKRESISTSLPKMILPNGFETSILLQSEGMDESMLTRMKDLKKRSCPICLDPFLPLDEVCWSMNSECRHAFHLECVLNWLLRCGEQGQVCPMCRSPFI